MTKFQEIEILEKFIEWKSHKQSFETFDNLVDLNKSIDILLRRNHLELNSNCINNPFTIYPDGNAIIYDDVEFKTTYDGYIRLKELKGESIMNDINPKIVVNNNTSTFGSVIQQCDVNNSTLKVEKENTDDGFFSKIWTFFTKIFGIK